MGELQVVDMADRASDAEVRFGPRDCNAYKLPPVGPNHAASIEFLTMVNVGPTRLGGLTRGFGSDGGRPVSEGHLRSRS